MRRPLYQHMASRVQAIENCIASGNTEWQSKHEAALKWLAKSFLPSGGGFDSASTVWVEACRPNRLMLATSFHHMNGGGYYDGWTEHKITVRPSLASDFDLTIGGRDRNDIKDYIAEVFYEALRHEIDDAEQAELLKVMEAA